MTAQPVADPRPAVTVALIRDAGAGLETWMMSRPAGMAFAAGASVFPGGRVEPADAAVRFGTDADTDRWAARLGVDAATAGSLAGAALREVVEEAGVLLGDPPATVDDDVRRGVEDGRLPFADVLAGGTTPVAWRCLQPWMRWVTPASERRRYDTWFFAAALPSSLEVGAPNSEATTAGWIGVTDVLAAGERGETLLLPPTVVALRGLRNAGSVHAVHEASQHRSMDAVAPEVEHRPDGSVAVRGSGEVVVVASRRPMSTR